MDLGTYSSSLLCYRYRALYTGSSELPRNDEAGEGKRRRGGVVLLNESHKTMTVIILLHFGPLQYTVYSTVL